ncbi:MAG: hypothetical protein ACXVLO_11865 [Acidimicrobiia bacterium]
MKKLIMIAASVVGLCLVVRVLASRLPSIDWEQCLEQMPDTAPPKWMFTNINAIRENTDRILARLDEVGAGTPT